MDLPNELIAILLGYAGCDEVSFFESIKNYKRLFTLSIVCKQWNEICSAIKVRVGVADLLGRRSFGKGMAGMMAGAKLKHVLIGEKGCAVHCEVSGEFVVGDLEAPVPAVVVFSSQWSPKPHGKLVFDEPLSYGFTSDAARYSRGISLSSRSARVLVTHEDAIKIEKGTSLRFGLWD